MQTLFPKRVLAWSAVVAGCTGLSFGLLLRYHFTQQFANSEGLDQTVQTLDLEPPNQNGELFLPKRTPPMTETARSTQPSPALAQPEPTSLDPQNPGIEYPEASSPFNSRPSLPDPAYNPSGSEPAEIYNPSYPDPQSFPQEDDFSASPQAPASLEPPPPSSPEQSFSSTEPSALEPAMPQPTTGSERYSAPPP